MGDPTLYKANMKIADKNVKSFEEDFKDIVPSNCCLLEIRPIYDIRQYSAENG